MPCHLSCGYGSQIRHHECPGDPRLFKRLPLLKASRLRKHFEGVDRHLSRQRILCISESADQTVSKGEHRKVLILGGTGRVGASTASALLRKCPDAEIILASRSTKSYEAAVKKRPELANAKFLAVDIDDAASLEAALKGVSLVVHTAGPFQRKDTCGVLEAAIATKTPYMDVCDDTEHSQRLRAYSDQAKAAGVPAITTAGIYPGTSNVMAAHMISIARREYAADWSYASSNGASRGANGQAISAGSSYSTTSSSSAESEAAQPEPLRSGIATMEPDEGKPGATPSYTENSTVQPVEPRRVLYSYYTAGSGGVGPTILETSLLLAGTPVTVFANGEKLILPPITRPREVDFGPPIRKATCYLYNLPEVESTFETMRVPTVSARFSTAPFFWNWAMIAVARLAPRGFLEDRAKSKWLAKLSDPWVRLVDPLVGEAVGMRVDVDLEDGTTAAGVYVHKKLSDCVGVCTAAFAQAMLAGETQPGVWFPEEREALQNRRALLQSSAEGCVRFELNRPPWALESAPRRLGFGIYID